MRCAAHLAVLNVVVLGSPHTYHAECGSHVVVTEAVAVQHSVLMSIISVISSSSDAPTHPHTHTHTLDHTLGPLSVAFLWGH